MVNDEIGVVDDAIVIIESAATIAAIITGRWKMRVMFRQLVEKG
jgi:hypothetical protein